MPSAITPPDTPKVKVPQGITPDLAGKKKRIVVFSDFDGTIFMQDTGHVLFDNHGCGKEKREELDEKIKTGERSFRDVSEEMWASLNVRFEDGFATMRGVLEIDRDFQAFHQYCVDNDIPFNVISAGLEPVLRRVLDHFLGEKESSHVNIVANGAEISADGATWRPRWLHDGALGHDKAISMQEARREAELACRDSDAVPLVVFIGDGVSDLPAAREADVLFARRGLRLEEYCQEHSIPYTPFDTFADIQRDIRKVKEEGEDKAPATTATTVTGGPSALPSHSAGNARANLRANLFRRLSSQSHLSTSTQKVSA